MVGIVRGFPKGDERRVRRAHLIAVTAYSGAHGTPYQALMQKKVQIKYWTTSFPFPTPIKPAE